MIKIVALIKRNPALSPEEFRDYWLNVHVPMIKSRLPGLIHYTGSFPVHAPGTVLPAFQADLDLIVELGFPDRETMEANMTGPEFLAADRVASSERLMDMERTQAVIVEEIRVDLRP